MLRILADNKNDAAAADNFALLAEWFDWCANFHDVIWYLLTVIWADELLVPA